MTTDRAAQVPLDAPSPATYEFCDPDLCPCHIGTCTLSRVARAMAGDDALMAGQHTLTETERAVSDRSSNFRDRRNGVRIPAIWVALAAHRILVLLSPWLLPRKS